jgi:hypothetical protein
MHCGNGVELLDREQYAEDADNLYFGRQQFVVGWTKRTGRGPVAVRG